MNLILRYFDVCTMHPVQFIIQTNKYTTYIYICICVYIYIYIYIHTHTHTHTHTHIHQNSRSSTSKNVRTTSCRDVFDQLLFRIILYRNFSLCKSFYYPVLPLQASLNKLFRCQQQNFSPPPKFIVKNELHEGQ